MYRNYYFFVGTFEMNERNVGSFPEIPEPGARDRRRPSIIRGQRVPRDALKNALWALNRPKVSTTDGNNDEDDDDDDDDGMVNQGRELAYIVQLSLVAREHAI